MNRGQGHTSGHHGLHPCPINEGSFDHLCANVRPVDALLLGIVIHCCYVVNHRHGEGDDVVVIWILDVHASDLDLTGVE